MTAGPARIMRIRELKRRSGEAVVSCWPPLWASSYGRGSKLAIAEEGILRSVERIGNRLSLTMEYDGREHVGGLEWDAPPSMDEVEKLLRAHVGEEIKALGELTV